MQRCKQMSDIAKNGVMFQSESSAGKEYQVFAFRLNEMDFCNCVAFVMARNKEAKRLGLKDKGISAAGLASDCKHLREVRRVTCQWTQQTEEDYRYDGTCPKCGGPVVDEGKKMVPDGAGTDHVDDLRAMLAELKGGSDAEMAGMEADAAEATADAIDAEHQAEADEIDSVIEAADVGTADELAPVDRRHGAIPDDPAEWLEDLIANRNGVVPTGDDWKQLRELWGPIYGKRKLDAAYKAASTPDAILARRLAAPEVGSAAPDDVIAELEDEYHGTWDVGSDPKARLEELRAAIHAENISYGEIAELQGMVEHIDPHDAELLEWAGVSEEDYRAGLDRLHDDTGTPTAVQIDEPDAELLDGNGDADPAFFGEQMVPLSSVIAALGTVGGEQFRLLCEVMDEVLGEYLAPGMAATVASRIQHECVDRMRTEMADMPPEIAGLVRQAVEAEDTAVADATITPLKKPGPDAAAERLAAMVKP